MKFTMIIFLAFLGCSHITAIKNKVKPPKQETCGEEIVHSSANEFLHFGDGLGEKKFFEIKKQMLETCPDCDGLYAGDVYPYGVQNHDDYHEKVVKPLKGLDTFISHGNHDYLGDPKKILSTNDIARPCAYYGIRSNNLDIFVFDTNHLGDHQLEFAEKFLCGSPKAIALGHHSVLSYEESHGDQEELDEMKPLHKIFSKCKTMAYLSGHSHALEHNRLYVAMIGHITQSVWPIENFVSGASGRDLRGVEEKGLFNKSLYGFGKISEKSYKFFDEKGKEIYKFDFRR